MASMNGLVPEEVDRAAAEYDGEDQSNTPANCGGSYNGRYDGEFADRKDAMVEE